MIGAYRIDAYAIASADGMIADASGVQPASLQFEADRRHFQNGLNRANAVVNGRHSAEGDPNAMSRRRLIVTRQVADLAPDPAGASFEAACTALGLSSGEIAVIGGPQVYTLFLKLGYDCFRLTRAVKVRLPGGLPLFNRETFGGDPEAALKAAGLTPGPTRWLEDGLSLTDWKRAR